MTHFSTSDLKSNYCIYKFAIEIFCYHLTFSRKIDGNHNGMSKTYISIVPISVIFAISAKRID